MNSVALSTSRIAEHQQCFNQLRQKNHYMIANLKKAVLFILV